MPEPVGGPTHAPSPGLGGKSPGIFLGLVLHRCVNRYCSLQFLFGISKLENFFKIFRDLKLGGGPPEPSMDTGGTLGYWFLYTRLLLLRCCVRITSWACTPLALDNHPNFKNFRGPETSKIFSKLLQKLRLIEFKITWGLETNVLLGFKVKFLIRGWLV